MMDDGGWIDGMRLLLWIFAALWLCLLLVVMIIVVRAVVRAAKQYFRFRFPKAPVSKALYCLFLPNEDASKENLVFRHGKQDYVYAFESEVEALVFASTYKDALWRKVSVEPLAKAEIGTEFIYFKPAQLDYCLVKI
ncbi:MAG: hypothetical protein V4671_01955 [Armatimonadota bacterium]